MPSQNSVKPNMRLLEMWFLKMSVFKRYVKYLYFSNNVLVFYRFHMSQFRQNGSPTNFIGHDNLILLDTEIIEN